MFYKCCVSGCLSEWQPATRKVKQNLQFHRFPLTNHNLLEKWIKALRWPSNKATAVSVICSRHFTEDSYLQSASHLKILKKDAVPSIFNSKLHNSGKQIYLIHQNAMKLPPLAPANEPMNETNKLHSLLEKASTAETSTLQAILEHSQMPILLVVDDDDENNTEASDNVDVAIEISDRIYLENKSASKNLSTPKISISQKLFSPSPIGSVSSSLKIVSKSLVPSSSLRPVPKSSVPTASLMPVPKSSVPSSYLKPLPKNVVPCLTPVPKSLVPPAALISAQNAVPYRYIAVPKKAVSTTPIISTPTSAVPSSSQSNMSLPISAMPSLSSSIISLPNSTVPSSTQTNMSLPISAVPSLSSSIIALPKSAVPSSLPVVVSLPKTRVVGTQIKMRFRKKVCPQVKREYFELQRKIKNMDAELKQIRQKLKKTRNNENSLLNIVNRNLNGFSRELFRNEVFNLKSLKSSKSYSPEIKDFANMIYAYSPMAYRFLQQSLTLPCGATVKKNLKIAKFSMNETGHEEEET